MLQEIDSSHALFIQNQECELPFCYREPFLLAPKAVEMWELEQVRGVVTR